MSKKMISTHEKGDESENLAVQHLVQKGFEILHRNWRFQHYELDVVARKNGILTIVEVKSLFSNTLQEPYQSVNRNKQRMIIAATNAYIRKHNIDSEVQFDIVSIIFGKQQPVIDHIENAFYPRVQ